jgi:superfamily II DNA or RNA helicase
VAWNAGDHLILRGAAWRLVQSIPHVDCTALDLVSLTQAPVSRTMLLPFEQPRPVPRRRLTVLSPRLWSGHVGALLGRTYPYGGLRFCPRAIQLLAYQLEPALAVFRHGATRLLIGDDVGLGKTVEAGVILREVVGRRADARVMIVVPAALRAQWQQELASLFEMSAIDASAAWLRTINRELPPDVNPWSVPGVYLASIDFVKQPEVLTQLESIRWDLIVFDEAHGATPGTGRLAAADALASRSAIVLLLSATPHSGSQEQFDALCRIGRGPARSPLVCFRRSRGDVDVAQAPVRSRVLTVAPTDPEREMHRQLERYTARLSAAARADDRNPALLATVFRKRALSSAGSLALSLSRRLAAMEPAPQFETQRWLPLGSVAEDESGQDREREEVLGGRGMDDPIGEKAAIEHTLRAAVAAAAAESKAALLVRLLCRVHEPAIVFSEYRDTAIRLCERIAAIGRQVVLLHGGLSPEERVAATAEFARGGAVMVATDAASEGLNLHHCCRLVIHYELPWSPARLHQRCGRVNRIGQRRRVHEIALVSADTAEQLVLHPLLRRALHSGEFIRGSVVHQLPEALVASHVLTGRSLADLAIPAPRPLEAAERFVTLDLRAEACAEVRGLETIRRLDHRSPSSRARPVIPVARARKRRHLDRSVTVVFLVGFRDGAGEMLEQTLVPVTVDYAGRRWARGSAALPAHAAATLERLTPHLRRVVETFARARASSIAAVHRDNAALRDRRRLAMSGAMASAARALVQPGLFARGSLRTGPASAHGLLDQPPEQPIDDEIAWQSSIEAVLCGGLP